MSKVDMLCVVFMILVVLVWGASADLKNTKRIQKLETKVEKLEARMKEK